MESIVGLIIVAVFFQKLNFPYSMRMLLFGYTKRVSPFVSTHQNRASPSSSEILLPSKERVHINKSSFDGHLKAVLLWLNKTEPILGDKNTTSSSGETANV